MAVDDSELENEFELEIKDEELEFREERELEREFEKDEEMEAIEEKEVHEELEYEEPGDREFEAKIQEYTEKLYELTEREFESELELDTEVDRVLYEMERDFFFKGLWKKIKQGGKQLIKAGVGLAKNLPIMQVVKGVTSLARGNLKGLLKPLMKTALGFIPGVGPIASMAAGPLVDMVGSKFGFEVSQDKGKNKAQLEKAVRISATAYDNLAKNLDKNVTDPKEASRLAAASFYSALDKAKAKIPVSMKKGCRVINIKRGDCIIIKGV